MMIAPAYIPAQYMTCHFRGKPAYVEGETYCGSKDKDKKAMPWFGLAPPKIRAMWRRMFMGAPIDARQKTLTPFSQGQM